MGGDIGKDGLKEPAGSEVPNQYRLPAGYVSLGGAGLGDVQVEGPRCGMVQSCPLLGHLPDSKGLFQPRQVVGKFSPRMHWAMDLTYTRVLLIGIWTLRGIPRTVLGVVGELSARASH